MTTIPDHVGREAVRLLNQRGASYYGLWEWPRDAHNPAVITVAKLLMNPPAPMTDPDEEAAKRVLRVLRQGEWVSSYVATVTEQMRKEREAWEAGRP